MTSPLSLSAPPGSLQSLPPAQARFCLSVSRFVEKELELRLEDAAVLVGFSGGADSTALLLSLHYLAPRLGCTLIAAHLDHQLRPTSEQEALACREFCAGLGVPFISGKDCVSTLSQRTQCGVEDAGRAARYRFYAETAEQHGCDWIAVGHTANDLAEDVLMRLVRGTGWPGLSGMAAVDGERRIVRPLLLSSRAGIEDFLTGLGVGWLTDESNADPAYFRNRIRHTLLPLLLRENPNLLDGIAGLWRLGRIDRVYFESVVPGFVSNDRLLPTKRGEHGERTPDLPGPATPERHFSPHDQLMALPKALRLRLYKKELDALGPGQARLSSLLALDDAFLRQGGKTKHQFPGGKLALLSKKGILWVRG